MVILIGSDWEVLVGVSAQIRQKLDAMGNELILHIEATKYFLFLSVHACLLYQRLLVRSFQGNSAGATPRQNDELAITTMESLGEHLEDVALFGVSRWTPSVVDTYNRAFNALSKIELERLVRNEDEQHGSRLAWMPTSLFGNTGGPSEIPFHWTEEMSLVYENDDSAIRAFVSAWHTGYRKFADYGY